MPGIDETKIVANITNISGKKLVFHVLTPVVNGQSVNNYNLNNATLVTIQGELTEFSSEPFRSRQKQNPYYNQKFPQGYVAGIENFYPMLIEAGQTMNNLCVLKEHLDGLVVRNLVTYTTTSTLQTTLVEATDTIGFHGELVEAGKTAYVEKTAEVINLIADGKLTEI